MGAAEMLEDSFPHGTREGYEKGCRGSHCPAAEDGYLTCFQARTRYVSDFAYRRRVDAGMSLAELAAADEQDAAEQRARFASLGASGKKAVVQDEPAAETVAVQEKATPDGEIGEATSRDEAGGIAYERHGTTSGYYAGCRDKEACPGLSRVGKSCTQAVNEYQRDRKRARRAEQQASAAVAKAAPLVEAVPAEPDALAAAVERAEAAERRAEDAEAQLAAAVKRNAELLTRVAGLEMELDVAKSAVLHAPAIALPVQDVPRVAPSRFRFQRDERGGVVVDVDGQAPGFVRFELDEAGALTGVAVQAGK